MTENEEKFYQKYHKPTIDEYIKGFSGIDPALKANPSELNHELLNNLLGGDETGHYHLTKLQIRKLNAYSPDGKYPPVIDDNQVINCVAGEEISPYTIAGTYIRME